MPDQAGLIREDALGASTFLEKGWSLISRGDHAGAEPLLRRAIELSPRDAQARALLAWSFMHRDRLDEAQENIRQSLELQPSSSLAHVGAGYVAKARNEIGEAIEHLTKALRLDNDAKATLYAHYYLGVIYLEREMYADARAFLERALALGPNLIEAQYWLGRTLWLSGDPEEARRVWERGAKSSRFNQWGKHCSAVLDAVERGMPFPEIRQS